MPANNPLVHQVKQTVSKRKNTTEVLKHDKLPINITLSNNNVKTVIQEQLTEAVFLSEHV